MVMAIGKALMIYKDGYVLWEQKFVWVTVKVSLSTIVWELLIYLYMQVSMHETTFFKQKINK